MFPFEDFACVVLICISILPDLGTTKELVRDDFVYPRPDALLWTAVNRPSNTQVASYTPSNVRTFNGYLSLAVKEDHTVGRLTSARLHTGTKFAFHYGTLEVRARMPPGPGVLANIWLASQACATKDCFDYYPPSLSLLHYRTDQPNQVTSTAYYPKTAGPMLMSKAVIMSRSLAQDFHTFKLEWRPDRVTWSVDGQKYMLVVDPSKIPQIPLYLIMNVIPGPDAGNRTWTQSAMQVDYVVVRDLSSSAGWPVSGTKTLTLIAVVSVMLNFMQVSV